MRASNPTLIKCANLKRIATRSIFAGLWLIVLPYGAAQQFEAAANENRLEFSKEYRDAALLDLSPDGLYALLWHHRWFRSYYSIVDRFTGNQAQRKFAKGFPHHGTFSYDGKQALIYRQDFGEGSFSSSWFLWNPAASAMEKVCPGDPILDVDRLDPVSRDLVVGYSSGLSNIYSIFKASLTNCAVLLRERDDPRVDGDYELSQVMSWAVSPGNDALAYVTFGRRTAGDGNVVSRDKTLWIRAVEDLKIKAQIDPQAGWAYEAIAFGPDGREVAVLAVVKPFDRSLPDAVFIFDVESGELLRRLDGIQSDTPLFAVSPDGTLMATSIREKREPPGSTEARAIVYLYDYRTGRRVGQGVSPWRKNADKRRRARMRKIRFSPDGKQLWTQTLHVRVWNIKQPPQAPEAGVR